jgi:Lanthionine-containing peptide SapB precursor RamS
MALLDMQGMELKGEDCWHSDGGGPHSGLSLLLCDSAASVTLCL